MLSVNNLVSQFTSHYQTMWWNTAAGFPEMLDIYRNSRERLICQKAKERELDQFIRESFRDMKKLPATETELLELQEKFKLSLKRLYYGKISIRQDGNLSLLDDFYPVAKDFIKAAREFDPQVTSGDIFQAIRNVWIMNSIQLLLGLPVKMTDAIFAYSMLYPYTDNILDNVELSLESKRCFNGRLREYLTGKSVAPENSRELQIFQLVAKIRAQYPQRDNPGVFQSMLAIQNAQEKSLGQQNRHTSPYETDILGISIEKGGSSVLADGYLVAGALEPEAAETIFGLGVFLQFIDDLEDVARDYQNGHLTIFSQTIPAWPLDGLTNRLLQFIHGILDSATCFNSNPSGQTLKDLTLQNSHQMIFEAVARNCKFYSKNYVRAIEKHTPVRLGYLRKLNPRIQRKFSSLKNIRFPATGSTISTQDI